MVNEYTYRLNITATALLPLDTSSCFDSSHVDAEKSPIDRCFDKMNQLNLIHTNFTAIQGIAVELVHTQNNLVLLGYISAVESYLREIIRRLIHLDGSCRKESISQQVSYGAAINYPEHLLAEALLEKTSYASKSNIIEAFKTFLGIKGHIPNELDTALNEFEKICHFRHCVVHRFGKLGSSNAIKFGLDGHILSLEKPLTLDASKLYTVYQICENTVLVVNHFLFTRILMRTANPSIPTWKWDLRKDKSLFKMYYSLFYSTLKSQANTNVLDAYRQLKDYKTGM